MFYSLLLAIDNIYSVFACELTMLCDIYDN